MGIYKLTSNGQVLECPNNTILQVLNNNGVNSYSQITPDYKEIDPKLGFSVFLVHLYGKPNKQGIQQDKGWYSILQSQINYTNTRIDKLQGNKLQVIIPVASMLSHGLIKPTKLSKFPSPLAPVVLTNVPLALDKSLEVWWDNYSLDME